MRILSMNQRYFDFSESSSLKVVDAYRQKYQRLSELLDANPQLLQLAHLDWAKLLSSSNKGRRATFTTEQLLRSLIIKFIEQCSYRKTVVLIDTSEFLRYFSRLDSGSTMDFTFLSRAFCLLSTETVEAMNQVVNRYAVAQELISGEKQRLDSTVYENGVKTSRQISQHEGPQLDHSTLPGSVQDQTRPQPPYELQASLGRPGKILNKDIRRPSGLHRFFNILG